MVRRNRVPLGLISLTLLLAGLVFHADAGIMVFHNRDAWQAALGVPPGDVEDFTISNRGTSFATNALNFGSFDLSTLGIAEPGTNFIAQPPFDDVNNSIDQTAFANMFLDSTRGVALRAHSPSFAFGGDFSGSGLVNFSVFALNQQPEFVGGPQPGVKFFGFISTEAFNRIEFQYAGPTGSATIAGMDNVFLVSNSEIPEPASLLLLGMGATLLGGYGCWKSRRDQAETPQNDA